MDNKVISIIGLGLIGGSIAKALKNGFSSKHKVDIQNAPSFVIKGYDKKNVLDEAFNDKTIDAKLNSIEDSIDSDVIFLCLPTELSLECFTKLAPVIKENTVITDVCGVKGVFENEWRKIKSKGFYIGGHPMTGKETSGYEGSDPLLFENSVYIISGLAKKTKILDEFLEIIKLLGARIRFLDPYIHDKVISRVSHLPQLLSIALVNSAAENEKGINFLDFAAGGFRDMTRIASSNFDIWEPVLKLNRDEIIKSIELLTNNLEDIKQFVLNNDNDKLDLLFQKARTKRDEIPKNTKGFINPLSDIFIYVKDEPGVLSKITTLLYNNGINIKDMELLKIREGTGGTFRMSFENDKTAQRARKLVEESGFATKQ